MNLNTLDEIAVARKDASACRGYLLILASECRNEQDADRMLCVVRDLVMSMPDTSMVDMVRTCIETGRIETSRTAALEAVDALEAGGRAH